MTLSIISTKGQVTLPREMRVASNLKRGDKLSFTQISKDIYIVKPIKKNFLDFGGSIKPKNKPEDFESIRKTVMKRIAYSAATKNE